MSVLSLTFIDRMDKYRLRNILDSKVSNWQPDYKMYTTSFFKFFEFFKIFLQRALMIMVTYILSLT
jgi:hypothetical protein